MQNVIKTWALWFQKLHVKLGELSLEIRALKSEKSDTDKLFLSKAYISAGKFQRNYVS